MRFYGFNEHSLTWFKSYLSGRTQIVKSNSKLSTILPVHMGVPQGSILGPFLFLLYVNDLPSCLKNANCDMYADDSTLKSSGCLWRTPKLLYKKP